MKNSSIACGAILALALWGCVSAERMAEYSAWQQSDDGVANVSFDEFESKYQNGWRERAATKKAQKVEFEEWKNSEDAVANVPLEGFVSKYQNGWRERAATKKAQKVEFEEWKNSEDAVANVSFEGFVDKYEEGWRERAEAKKKIRLEYEEWRESADAPDEFPVTVSLDKFVTQYRSGWRERAATKKAQRLEFEEWKKSDDAVDGVSIEEFVSKYHDGWRERAETKEKARLAKEESERAEKRRLAMRTELCEKAVEQDLAAIKKCYSNGRQYENPFLGNRRYDSNERTDWLSKWALPRLELTESDALAGEALLSEFGIKYLPNAYANYEKKRDAVAELQQVFNEEFPQPWTIKSSDPKWNSFNKVLEKFVKARTEFFICHDELCHYWLLSRFGVIAEKDFAQIDAKPLAIHLLPENVERAGYTLMEATPMEGKVSDFAVKYAPESNAIYQKMGREFKELDALLVEVFKQHIQMDDVRYSRVLAAAVAKRNDLVREMNTLSLLLQSWYMDHKTTEKSADDVNKCDVAMGKQLKPFMDALLSYIKEHALGPIIANSEMIAVPGQRYRIQRTEVTQLQWMMVMDSNPSKYRGPDRPVENVSVEDCQIFIKRLNELEGAQFRLDGMHYRLPTEEEWEFACRAGSKGKWGRRANGEDGPLGVMGWCSCSGDSGAWEGGTHAVAMKEPNAWGLFDMHGNVWEWCGDLWGRCGYKNCVGRGGGWSPVSGHCPASARVTHSPDYRRNDLGFRLASPRD